jgi:O-antigen ligase
MEYGSFIFLSASFLAMVLAIFFSLSRGGLTAVGIGCAAVLVLRFWERIRRKSIAKGALAGLILVGLIAGYYYIRPNPALSPEEGGRITASNNVRWEIWRTTVREVITDRPLLGVGLGNYQNYFTELTRGRVNYDRIAPLALTPHNFVLSLWVNLGLVGLAAIVWLLVEVFRRTWRSTHDWIAAALSGSLMALLAHGLLDTPYFKNDLSLVFWTLIVLLVILAVETKKEVNA